MIKIIEPPPKVLIIHQHIVARINSRLSDEIVKKKASSTLLVTAVNNSRVSADVKRDIDNAVGTAASSILLIIIRATRNLEKPKIQLRDLEDSRIKQFCFFLVNLNLSQLHECQENNESVDTIITF